MGTMLLMLGVAIYLVGGIWLLVKAFQESIWWGLGSLLIPLVGLIFAIMHWAQCKKPFLIALAGLVLIIAGSAMAPQPEIAMPQ